MRVAGTGEGVIACVGVVEAVVVEGMMVWVAVGTTGGATYLGLEEGRKNWK